MKILEKKSTLKISKTYRALGTVISLTIYGHQDEELLDKTYQLIKYYEQLFTVNRDQSELMAVNHKAGIEPVQVSGAVYGLTKIALEKIPKCAAENSPSGDWFSFIVGDIKLGINQQTLDLFPQRTVSVVVNVTFK